MRDAQPPKIVLTQGTEELQLPVPLNTVQTLWHAIVDCV